MASTAHVPAWKRLGLKLKYAKDSASQDELSPRDSQHSVDVVQPIKAQQNHERKRSIATQDLTPAAKKVKTDSYNGFHSNHEHVSDDYQEEKSANDRFIKSVYGGRTTNGVTKTPQKIVFNDDSVESSTQAGDEPHPSTLTRKKSVTFTPETKAEDGASGQIFSKLWLSPTPAAPRAEVPSIEASTPTKTPEKTIVPIKSQTKSRDKPKTGKKVDKQATDQSDHDQRKLCIKYLDQFHNDKVNWKFNKSRQNDLIKHIWNTESIPPASNDALIAYIAGLQGAGPRQRILEGAVAILDPLLEKHKEALGELKMDSPEARRDAYERAFRKQIELIESTARSETDKEHLETLRRETEQAERAEALVRKVLWAELRPGLPFPDAIEEQKSEAVSKTEAVSSTASDVKPNTTQSKRKNRKSRTAVDSSSDSSSSEDDSDSDSSTD